MPTVLHDLFGCLFGRERFGRKDATQPHSDNTKQTNERTNKRTSNNNKRTSNNNMDDDDDYSYGCYENCTYAPTQRPAEKNGKTDRCFVPCYAGSGTSLGIRRTHGKNDTLRRPNGSFPLRLSRPQMCNYRPHLILSGTLVSSRRSFGGVRTCETTTLSQNVRPRCLTDITVSTRGWVRAQNTQKHTQKHTHARTTQTRARSWIAFSIAFVRIC